MIALGNYSELAQMAIRILRETKEWLYLRNEHSFPTLVLDSKTTCHKLGYEITWHKKKKLPCSGWKKLNMLNRILHQCISITQMMVQVTWMTQLSLRDSYREQNLSGCFFSPRRNNTGQNLRKRTKRKAILPCHLSLYSNRLALL